MARLARCATRGAPETAKTTAVGISARLRVLQSFRSERARLMAPAGPGRRAREAVPPQLTLQRLLFPGTAELRAPSPGPSPLHRGSLHDTLRSQSDHRKRLLPARAAPHSDLCWRLHALECRRRRRRVGAMAFTPASCSTSWLAAPCCREAPNTATHAAANIAAATAVQRRAAHPRWLPAAADRRTRSVCEAACALLPRSTHALPRIGAVLLAAALTNGEPADLAPPPEDAETGGLATLRRSCTYALTGRAEDAGDADSGDEPEEDGVINPVYLCPVCNMPFRRWRNAVRHFKVLSREWVVLHGVLWLTATTLHGATHRPRCTGRCRRRASARCNACAASRRSYGELVFAAC